MSDATHRSVLLEETLQALAIQPDGTYIDATFGRGGHARAILARLGPAGRLLGMDRDPDAIAEAQRLEAEDARFQAVRAPFGQIASAARQAGLQERVQGIVMDLGVSSPQLDVPARGFSFGADGPLDMRMDPDCGESAAEWLAHSDEQTISGTLKDLGEERFARRIARAILAARDEAPILTTRRLAEIVARAVPTREPRKHPATRTFQALRIRVNDELGELERALAQLCDLLAPGGRLAVISFHSLEDRIVKRFIRDEAQGPRLPKGVPVMATETEGRLKIIGKPRRPGEAELAENPRARSAVLRVAERTA
jgi:16S rRNA (cytosine1402-N4)-methyltransferase